MKACILFFFLLTSCSVAKYYRAPEVKKELEKNALHLEAMVKYVNNDFLYKEATYKEFLKSNQKKNLFLREDLLWRLHDIRNKKDSLLQKGFAIQARNLELIQNLESKKNVSENDPVFDEIEAFSKIAEKEGSDLIRDLVEYQNASRNFLMFTELTRSRKKNESL